jgi:SpoVK/Ycf46/Vps4 family AAA+-type ATPase
MNPIDRLIKSRIDRSRYQITGGLMLDGYEQWKIVGYLRCLLEDSRLNAKAVCEVCQFIERNYTFLGISEGVDDLIEEVNGFQDTLSDHSVKRTEVRSISERVFSLLHDHQRSFNRPEPSSLEHNLGILGQELGFDTLESDLFNFLIRYFTHCEFRSFLDSMVSHNIAPLEICSLAIRAERSRVNERLHHDAPLLSTGVLRVGIRNGSDLDDYFDIPDSVRNALQKACGSNEDIRTCILGEPEHATLEWDDFEHLGENLERLGAFLSAAVEQKIGGVNVLLWGPPGTGKTELCKTLARHLDVRLYSIGEQDDEGGEPTRRERVSALQLAQNLLRYQNRSLLLFDEMDDLFEGQGLARLFGGRASMPSKVFTNRLFEKNPVPTLWVINDADLLDATVLRRMSLAVEVKVPPASVREQVWERVLNKNAMHLPSAEIKTLAELEVPPAVVDTAARVAKQIGGEMDDFRFATNGLVKVLSGKDPYELDNKSADFKLELMRTDAPLDKLTSQILKLQHRDFSLCLYGPPGTGKSAFVRHLAQSMGMPILQKHASDLLDPYVGNTEQNIAAAFREARHKEAFLVFDEADSLLGDRRHAKHNWEISQVNEMLTWMEKHPFPFACTTNLMDHLDQASLRRFTFKCHCNFLSPEQIVHAMDKFFTLELDCNRAASLEGLTPGDFALVQKKARILECDGDLAEVVSMLHRELEEKNYTPARRIGFCA